MTQETFEQELARRADDVHGAPFTFEDVRGKAVAIRRRRRAAVTGAVAAVVALVVLVPTILSGGNAPGSDAPDPAAPSGGAAVLHDGTLTRPDGTEVSLDVDTDNVLQLSLLTDDRIVVATMQPYAVSVFAPDGTLEQRSRVSMNSTATSAADDAVAWVGADGRVRVLSSGTAEPAVLAAVPAPGDVTITVDAVLGPDRVLVGDAGTTTGEVTAEGYQDFTTSEPLRVNDVSPGGDLWAVDYDDPAADPQFGCAGLYDPEAEEMVARNCDTSRLRFSPDGAHLLGLRGDNNQYGTATVLDLDLEPVWQWTWQSGEKGDTISRAAWADSERLLLSRTNWSDPTWSLERVDIKTGEVETIVPAQPGPNPEFAAEFLFSD